MIYDWAFTNCSVCESENNVSVLWRMKFLLEMYKISYGSDWENFDKKGEFKGNLRFVG
jgi:hypothetical protein